MTADPFFSVDLRSDTVTRPSAEMRIAMAHAEVGDDVNDGDPTVQRLQRTVAQLLGKQAALYFPSGTMANLTALLLHARPGTEVLIDVNGHTVHWDMAGSAAIAGIAFRLVTPSGLVMNADDVLRTMRPDDHYGIRASLLWLENTHNAAGGVITSLADMRALYDLARDASLPTHLDGARLWNASVASGVSLADYAACADTVMVSFSKGLGAPVGAALVGNAHDMQLADDIRKRLGGGMRQSGIIAAGALYGLENHFQRLEDDHAAARVFANIVDGVAGAKVVAPDTNIVMIDLPHPSADDVVIACEKLGVKVSAWTPSRVRAVTHLDAPLHLVEKGAACVAVALHGTSAG
ncbi:MAG: GntG family PLP-dependent aldolase [Gemmatimonas sp.]